MDAFDPLYKPLTVCAVIEYAKPFKRNRAIGSLARIVIPGGQTELHELVLRFRDKVVAHLDTDHWPGLERDLHAVLLELNERSVGFIVGEPKFPPEKLLELKSLATDLASKANYYADRHVRKLRQVIKRRKSGRGIFLIDVKAPQDGIRKLTESEKPTLFWD